MRVTICKAIGFLLVVGLLSTCKEKNNNLKTPQIEKGYVTGKVVDRNGKAVVGAQIFVANVAFDDCYIEGSTDQFGSYRFKLHEGTWVAYGFVVKKAEEQKFYLPLWPENSSVFEADGATRNFIWKPASNFSNPDLLNAYSSRNLTGKQGKDMYAYSLQGYAL